MALTQANLKLIEAVANNDLYSAKTAAMASLNEDKSKKNALVLERYKQRLRQTSTGAMIIPKNLDTTLVGAIPRNFDEKRFFLREQDASVVRDIRMMRIIADEMSSMNIPYKNTALFYGPSGTGKTELGKYIAYKMNLPFFYLSFSSVIDSYMGSTSKNMRKIFEFCNSIPCVLMLDELDCISMKRAPGGSHGADGELERTTISLMQEMERIPNHLVLLAATNRLDMIDDAILRRFSIKHEVRNMSKEDLMALCIQYLDSINKREMFSEAELADIVSHHNNPGTVLPDVIRMLGEKIYEQKKDILEKRFADNDPVSDIWNVTYTWQVSIQAETEEDAISAARTKRMQGYGAHDAVEAYKAERTEQFT
jgi:SpoVK/Ycf46/Vps4 family AAA+-type ATPase